MMSRPGGSPDIVIIGSGMGGATAAYALAPTGAKILILEKGHQLPQRPENRDARAISAAATSAPTNSGTTPPARASTPATTTTMAAIRSSTAPC